VHVVAEIVGEKERKIIDKFEIQSLGPVKE